MKIDLNNRKFRSLSNSENGEISGDTIFSYQQSEKIIWADYSGGSIVKGALIGKYIGDNKLEFVYQHINQDAELMTGKCNSTIELDESGRVRLNENWQWTCRDFSKGKSILVEILESVA